MAERLADKVDGQTGEAFGRTYQADGPTEYTYGQTDQAVVQTDQTDGPTKYK